MVVVPIQPFFEEKAISTIFNKPNDLYLLIEIYRRGNFPLFKLVYLLLKQNS